MSSFSCRPARATVWHHTEQRVCFHAVSQGTQRKGLGKRREEPVWAPPCQAWLPGVAFRQSVTCRCCPCPRPALVKPSYLRRPPCVPVQAEATRPTSVPPNAPRQLPHGPLQCTPVCEGAACFPSPRQRDHTCSHRVRGVGRRRGHPRSDGIRQGYQTCVVVSTYSENVDS